MNKLIKWAFLPLSFAMASTAYADFKSPSGNIICGADGNGVHCHISQTANSKPALKRPSHCQFDWGNDFYVSSRGGASMLCVSDFPFDVHGAQTLGYGQGISGNGWTCSSSTSGMTCKNRQGRGFSISKSKQRVF
ncbi:MAG: hypothetical protein Q4D05_06080 [Acinetobacter sp.]|nr:hypothetical protein [Acinetobacter sp.]